MSKNYEPDARYRYRRDSYTKGDVDTLLDGKANVGDTYTKAEADALLDEKADTSDTYTKPEVDALIEESGGEKSVVEVSGASYVISASDAGKWLRFTSQDPVFVVWPIEAEFTTGQEVELFRTGGPVTVFSEWAQDVRFNGEDDFRLNAKYTQVRAVNGALNEWDCTYSGDVVFGVYQSPYYISNPGSDPMPVDPHFDNVVLLLRFVGADGSTTITDSSADGATVTAIGNAKIDTSVTLFGLPTLELDGSGDYLNAESALDESGPFTLEAFFRPDGYQTFSGIFHLGNQDNSTKLQLDMRSSGKLNLFAIKGGGVKIPDTISASSVMPLSTWTHVALCHDGAGFYEVFAGGVSVLSYTAASAFMTSNTIQRIASAYISNTAQSFNGNVAQVRFTDYRRYTSAFTPPDAAFPTI